MTKRSTTWLREARPPTATLGAFASHDHVEPLLAEDPRKSARILEEIEEVGIDMTEATSRLIQEGVKKFEKPFEHMLGRLEQKKAA